MHDTQTKNNLFEWVPREDKPKKYFYYTKLLDADMTVKLKRDTYKLERFSNDSDTKYTNKVTLMELSWAWRIAGWLRWR